MFRAHPVLRFNSCVRINADPHMQHLNSVNTNLIDQLITRAHTVTRNTVFCTKIDR
jgi:hypothetical protein